MSTQKMSKLNFSEIVIRIMLAKGLSKEKQVAEILGLSPTALATRKKRNVPPITAIDLFCERERFNREWIYYGNGERKPSEVKDFPLDLEYKILVEAIEGAGLSRDEKLKLILKTLELVKGIKG